jgi:hypothetical protein
MIEEIFKTKPGDYLRWWFKSDGYEKSCGGSFLEFTPGEGLVGLRIMTIVGQEVIVNLEDITKFINFSRG